MLKPIRGFNEMLSENRRQNEGPGIIRKRDLGMKALRPSLSVLRALAGEGNYHAYTRLKGAKRGVLFLKSLRVSLAYTFHRNGPRTRATLVVANGLNQERLFHKYRPQLSKAFGEISLFSVFRLANTHDRCGLPRFSAFEMGQQLVLLLLVLASGQKRYLNLYYLAFAAAMQRVIQHGAPNLKAFICFNDQPFDVASMIVALRQRETCQTCVIQHGLILSEVFYFPTNAKEFWAWGPLSRVHFRSRHAQGRLIVKGRYADDTENARSGFLAPMPEKHPYRILVAPSHFHDEVKGLVGAFLEELHNKLPTQINLGLKLHPATKASWRLRRWLANRNINIVLEQANMEQLSEDYDLLFTKNSTSSIDFLLRGKPVIFSEFPQNGNFPSADYGFGIDQLQNVISGEVENIAAKNDARKNFLKDALFV